jgi:hypothetical protein
MCIFFFFFFYVYVFFSFRRSTDQTTWPICMYNGSNDVVWRKDDSCAVLSLTHLFYKFNPSKTAINCSQIGNSQPKIQCWITFERREISSKFKIVDPLKQGRSLKCNIQILYMKPPSGDIEVTWPHKWLKWGSRPYWWTDFNDIRLVWSGLSQRLTLWTKKFS